MRQEEAGFTLIELLVAMTAASLLLAGLSWSVSRLGVQLRASGTQGVDEVEAFEPVLQAMIASVRPDGEGALQFSRDAVRFSAAAPGGAGEMGAVTVRFAVMKDGEGQYIAGDMRAQEDGRQIRRFSLRSRWDDIRIRSAGENAEGLPSGVKIDFRQNGMDTSAVALSRINSSADCVFDLISMACRP